MADNIKVLPSVDPSGVDTRTDEIAGVHFPVYKIAYGVDGVASLVDVSNLLPVGVYGANGNLIHIDEFSGAVGTIEQEHLKIHEGDGYTLGARLVIANVGGIVEIFGKVPVASFPHFRMMQVSMDGGPFDIDFYEGTTVSADGTPLPSFNNNRNSVNVAGLQLFSGPTITADGLLLEPVLAPGSKQIGAIGTDAANEWILAQSTDYMIRITNNTAGAGTSNATVNMFWYE